MANDGQIISDYKFPSPNPAVELEMVTYYSGGLRVKGLLARPADGSGTEGFLYLRGGIKNVGKVRPARIAQFASAFTVFHPSRLFRAMQGFCFYSFVSLINF